jgi:pilus assembly protein Flp/PilA
MLSYIRIVACWFGIESEKGVTAIEYGLIASLVALAIIAAATTLGTNLGTIFQHVADNLK